MIIAVFILIWTGVPSVTLAYFFVVSVMSDWLRLFRNRLGLRDSRSQDDKEKQKSDLVEWYDKHPDALKGHRKT